MPIRADSSLLLSSLTIVNKGSSLMIIIKGSLLMIVNKGSSFTINNEGTSLTIVNKTASFIKNDRVRDLEVWERLDTVSGQIDLIPLIVSPLSQMPQWSRMDKLCKCGHRPWAGMKRDTWTPWPLQLQCVVVDKIHGYLDKGS